MFCERAKNRTLCRVTAKKWYFVIVVMNINMLMDFGFVSPVCAVCACTTSVYHCTTVPSRIGEKAARNKRKRNERCTYVTGPRLLVFCNSYRFIILSATRMSTTANAPPQRLNTIANCAHARTRWSHSPNSVIAETPPPNNQIQFCFIEIWAIYVL